MINHVPFFNAISDPNDLRVRSTALLRRLEDLEPVFESSASNLSAIAAGGKCRCQLRSQPMIDWIAPDGSVPSEKQQYPICAILVKDSQYPGKYLRRVRNGGSPGP